MKTSQLNREQNTAEPIHHTEHVVVDGVDANGARAPINRGARIGLVQKRVHRDLPVHGVNAARIQCAGRLGILGPQGQRIGVDVVLDRGRRVMFIRLHEAEVRRIPQLETVVAVELELGGADQVRANLAWQEIRLETGRTHLIRSQTRIVKRLMGLIHKVTAGDE